MIGKATAKAAGWLARIFLLPALCRSATGFATFGGRTCAGTILAIGVLAALFVPG